MTMAVTLKQAAYISSAQCGLLWTANTLKTKMTAYIAAASPIFEDAVPNDRPVGDWLVPITSLVTVMPATAVPITQLNTTVEYLYRMCYAASVARLQNRITLSQSNALLAVWNAQIGS